MSGMVMAASELWKSGTFWAAIAAVAGIAAAAGGIVTAVVTHRVGTPLRRLVYGMRSRTPLLTAPDGVHEALELRHHGQVITDPHIVEVILEGQGRRDIPREAFDNGAPLRLDLGVRIVELLQVTHDVSASTRTLPTAIDSTAVTIGPGLIARRQKISITALIEGEPTLSLDAPLTDVSVRSYNPDESSRGSLLLMGVGLLAGAGAAAGSSAFINQAPPDSPLLVLLSGLVLMLMLIGLVTLWWRSRRGSPRQSNGAHD